MSAVHRIGELHVELTFESDSPWPQPMPHDRLLELVKGRMLPALDAVLDEMDDGRLRRIERLDIDLGDIPAHLLDAELAERLRELLRSALGEALHHPGGTGAPAPADDAALFERFLRSGSLDASADAHAHTALLDRLLANDSDALSAMLRRVAGIPGVVKRLAQQFDQSQLRVLLRLLARDAEPWLALVDGIGGAIAGDAGTRRLHLRVLWELVLAHVLDAPPGAATPALRAAASVAGRDASAQALLLAIGIDTADRTHLPDDAQERFAQALAIASAASICADWDELVVRHASALRAVMLRHGANQGLWRRIADQFPLSMLDDMATLAGSAAAGRERSTWADAMFEALAPAAAAGARIKTFVQMLFDANPDELPPAWPALRAAHADALAGAMRGIGARHDVWQRVAQRFPLALLDELTALLAPQALGPPGLSGAAQTPAKARSWWLASVMHLTAVPFDAARYRAALRAPSALVLKLWRQIEACLASPEFGQLRDIRRQEIAAHAAGSASPADFLRAAWEDLHHARTFDPAAVEARAATACVLRALRDADATALASLSNASARAAIEHIGANADVWKRVSQRFPVALLDDMTVLMAAQAPAILRRLGAAVLGERECWFTSMMRLTAAPFDAAGYTHAMERAVFEGAEKRVLSALLGADVADLAQDVFGVHSEAARSAIIRIGARADVWERVSHKFPLDVLHRMTALLAPQAGEILRDMPIADRHRWLTSFMHLTAMPFDAGRYAAAMGATGRVDTEQRVFSALLAADVERLPPHIFSTHSEALRAAIARIGARFDIWERVAQRFPLDVLHRMTALLAPRAEDILRDMPIEDRHRWLTSFMHLTAMPFDATRYAAAIGATGHAGTEQRVLSALLAADAEQLPPHIFSTHGEALRAAIARIGARFDIWERVAQRFPLDVLHRMTALLAPRAKDILRDMPIEDRHRWLTSFMHLTAMPFDATRYAAAMGATGHAGTEQRVLSALLAADAEQLPPDVFSTHSDVVRAAIARIGARFDIWERVAQRFPLDVLHRMTALLAPRAGDILRDMPIEDRHRWLTSFMHLTAMPFDATRYAAAMNMAVSDEPAQRILAALLAADAATLPQDLFGVHSDAARDIVARIGAQADVWERVAQRFPLDVLRRMTALLAPQAQDILLTLRTAAIPERDHWLASFMHLTSIPFDATGYAAAMALQAPALHALSKPDIPVLHDRVDPEQRVVAALLSADAQRFEAGMLTTATDDARRSIARIGARFDVWQGVAQRFPLTLLGQITALLAPQAAVILRDLNGGAGATAVPERRRWLASIMHLTAIPFDAARYAAAMRAVAPDNRIEPDEEAEPAQRILSALLAADAAALLPDTLSVHADAAYHAIVRIGARTDVWQPVAQRFPLALLDEITALLAPAALAILRQPHVAAGATTLRPRERWLAGIMHLTATPFDPARYAAAVGAPAPSTARSDATVQPVQHILAALDDADAAALLPDLLSTHQHAGRQAIARTGARFGVWQRVAGRFPLALLDELTALVAPQAPAILRRIAAASGAPPRQLWLVSIMHLAVTPFDAERYEAALRAPSAPVLGLWQQLATRMAAVENNLQRDMQMQAIAAHAAHSASPPDFLRAAHDALAHSQRIDLTAVDARARTAFLLRALEDGDAAGLTPAVFAGLGDSARKAIMAIGARAHLWERVARHFPAQVLDALRVLLDPHTAAGPQPDRARWLAAIMQLTAASIQPVPRAARSDNIAGLWQTITAHMTSPDSILQHAIGAHAERSTDTAAFLRAVTVALERGEAVDLEAIAEHVDSQPGAAEPQLDTTVPPPPEDPMPAATTTQALSDPDVLRQIAARLDNVGEHGKTLLGAAQAHAGRSAAPQAYLRQVLDDLTNERPVDLDDLDERFAEAQPPAPRRAATSCARALAAHAPQQRAALAPLLHGAGDDSARFSPALLESVVEVLAGADLDAVQRCGRELARHLPAAQAQRIDLQATQFAFDWFFEQRTRFEPAAYARALAAHLVEQNEPGAPAQRYAGAPATATASALDDECDALYLSNAGQVLAGPYLPRLFAMVGLTEGARFKSTEAAERAVHLVQFIVSGQTDCPEYQLGLNKVLCGLKLSAPIVREIVPTDEEREAVDTMLRAMIAHWKTIGNTSPDGLRQAFLQRPGRMHLKDDAWRLKVEAGSFDMLLDALPWSFSVIRHPWMERAVHVEWR
ncbi:contractile injection system tape measure protein [Massilia scottii]|uniref:contractile injection system tape measure protein n=1 Tax=Massilia scottii TaxID=3057166 RepID=UPI002796D8B3|nr:contractile injection system tape measure protein [Massilia sp. CCM 9029]MDQ1829279.1 contractile injection system tape measure protein [Massilia sp. CCM 9029]